VDEIAPVGFKKLVDIVHWSLLSARAPFC
jgi:hypothetical protein